MELTFAAVTDTDLTGTCKGQVKTEVICLGLNTSFTFFKCPGLLAEMC